MLFKRYILINVVLAVILYWPTEIISFEKYLKLKQYNILASNLGWEGGWKGVGSGRVGRVPPRACIKLLIAKIFGLYVR